MSTPPDRAKISLSDFTTYVLGGAVFAGLAIGTNPTWPMVFGMLGLCALVAYVFYFAWSRGMLESTETRYESITSLIDSKKKSD